MPFLERLQAQVKVGAHTPQVHRALDALQQVVHSPSAVSHVETRAQRPRGLRRGSADTAAEADLTDVAPLHIGDDDLHRDERHRLVDRLDEGFDTHHVAAVARKDQAPESVGLK